VKQKSKGTGTCGGDVEAGIEPARLTGAFERYRRAVSERRVMQMLHGRGAFSRKGPLSAWVVIWLMIFQRLDAKGTLSAAVRQLLTGGVRAFVRRPVGRPGEPLSANTSAYSQARSKLPPALIEKVSDMIFESLREQVRSLPGLELPMFLLDGTSIQLQHSRELLGKWPPARNQWKFALVGHPRSGGSRCDQRLGGTSLLGTDGWPCRRQ
jgi:hypothetical protein